MKIDLHPRDVAALEQQDPWIKRAVAAERDANFATERAHTWIAEAARLRESVTGLSRTTDRLRNQRNWAFLLAVVGIGAAVSMAVRG